MSDMMHCSRCGDHHPWNRHLWPHYPTYAVCWPCYATELRSDAASTISMWRAICPAALVVGVLIGAMIATKVLP